MNIINQLDEYLLESTKRDRKSHYPSDVTACLRQLAYKWKNTEQSDPPTAGAILKMEFGNQAELILEGFFKWQLERGDIIAYDSQIEVWGEEPELEYPIHGYMDFIVTDKDSQVYGVECKSSYGRGVKYIQQNGPKHEHLLQVYLYLKYTELERFYLVYLGRDNGYRTQFEILWRDGEMYVDGGLYAVNHEFLISRLRAAELSAGEEVLPVREFNAAIVNGEFKDKFQRKNVEYRAEWQCSYCNYRSMCYAEQLKGGVWHGEDRIE